MQKRLVCVGSLSYGVTCACLLCPVHDKHPRQNDHHTYIMPQVDHLAIQHAPHERDNRYKVGGGTREERGAHVNEFIKEYQSYSRAENSQKGDVHKGLPSTRRALEFRYHIRCKHIGNSQRPHCKKRHARHYQRFHALQAMFDDVHAAAVANRGDHDVDAIEGIIHVGVATRENENRRAHNTDDNAKHAHPRNGLLEENGAHQQCEECGEGVEHAGQSAGQLRLGVGEQESREQVAQQAAAQ